jgi:Peptidase family M28
MSIQPAGYRLLQATLLIGFMVLVGGLDRVRALAEEPIDYQANARIRAEGRDRSQIMRLAERTFHQLHTFSGQGLARRRGAPGRAIGCAVMMEAARILKTVRLKPRRTIRVALWSGEEQGLLGSKAYVRQHFGSFEEPAPRLRRGQRVLQRRFGHGADSRGDRIRSGRCRDRRPRGTRSL